MRTAKWIACGVVACGTAPMMVYAATGEASASSVVPSGALEEIIVTAEKRETDLQHTSISVGVVSGADIEAQGITQLDDALKNMVGVVVTRTGLSAAPTIRGVGPTIETTTGGSAGVSSLFDGVYTQNNYSSRIGFYDVARLEVLRGPQGTLYGRNSEGGVVDLLSNDPTHRLEGSASADIGNYSLVNITGMLNIPLSDALALRVAAASVDRRGYLSNGQDDNRAQGARAKLLYQPSENWSLLIGAETTHLSGEGPGTVNAFINAPSASVAYTSAPGTTSTGLPTSGPSPSSQIDEDTTYKVWAKLVADVRIGQLTLLPSYQYQSEPKELLNNGQVSLLSTDVGSTIERSVELRLASEPDARVSWVGGYYRYHYHHFSPGQYSTIVNATGNIVIDPNPGTASDSFGFEDSTGVFGQAMLPISDRWRLIAGLRRSDDKKTSLFKTSGEDPVTFASETPKSAEWTKTDWKAGTEFDVTSKSMLYVTASTGYRAGGFTPNYPHPAYAPENLRSYELGSKNQFLDNKLRVNAAFYDYDYQNYQLITFQLCGLLAGPGAPACTNEFLPFNSVVVNLPKVSVRGLELESMYLPTPDDRVTANLALQRSRIESAVDFAPGTPLQGHSLPNSPKVSFNASYRHSFHVDNATISPQIGPRYASSSYVAVPESATSTQKAWWQWDASLQFMPDAAQWSVNAYVKNATDTVVKTNYIAAGAGVMTLQPPRTYGVSVSARF